MVWLTMRVQRLRNLAKTLQEIPSQADSLGTSGDIGCLVLPLSEIPMLLYDCMFKSFVQHCHSLQKEITPWRSCLEAPCSYAIYGRAFPIPVHMRRSGSSQESPDCSLPQTSTESLIHVVLMLPDICIPSGIHICTLGLD